MKSGLARPALLLAAAALAAGGLAAVQGTARASSITPAAAPRLIELGNTTTPIKHVIVIIGENHSFDNVFATYTPQRRQHIWNLLTERIVNEDGTPGPNFARAAQLTASDTGSYTLSPQVTGQYQALPQPNTTYVSSACDGGLTPFSADTRFPATLPNGPFQITKYVPYDDSHPGCPFSGAFLGDPLHRFYQMWQQTAVHQGQLNTWVANTAGDDNGANPPAAIFQGAVSMGFYNMAQGDAPYFERLADQYAISDNYHQAVQGGTGANHIALGTGWW
jgi:phospholipase C